MKTTRSFSPNHNGLQIQDVHFGKEREKRKPENLLTFRMDQLARNLPSSNLTDVDEFIVSELQRLRRKAGSEHDIGKSSKEHFLVYKQAFDQLIEHEVAVSKELLTAVKAEYEECIAALEKGQSQAVFLQNMLESTMVEKSTLRHYINRGDELEEKLEKLQAHNAKLRREIISSREAREQRIASAESKSLVAVKETRMLIPGLNMEELTDVATLSGTLWKLEAQVQELNKATETKFAEKKRKGLLQKQLLDKENTRGHLLAWNEKLKQRCETLKVAVEAAKSAVEDPDKVVHTYDIVVKALVDYGKSMYGKQSEKWKPFLSFDEDDPLKKKEAEHLLEYVDHFNDLMDFGSYGAAALHASNSPLSILRTHDTMIRFKHVSFDVSEGDKTPLLVFCEALMATASVSEKISAAMSTECIRCALSENRLDLATHWLAQGWLTHSTTMADTLRDYCNCATRCKCTAIPLAQTVYEKVGAHHQVTMNLCKQEKYTTMLQYSIEHGTFETEDYKNILLKYPSHELAKLMLTTKRNKKEPAILSFASLVGTLIKSGHETILLQVLKDISKGLLQAESSMSIISMNDLLSVETVDDDMSFDKWLHIVKLCQNENMLDIGVELLAALTTREAINNASIAYVMDYIS